MSKERNRKMKRIHGVAKSRAFELTAYSDWPKSVALI